MLARLIGSVKRTWVRIKNYKAHQLITRAGSIVVCDVDASFKRVASVHSGYHELVSCTRIK